MRLLKDDVIRWIKETVGDANVVIGMSGGKDSTIVAAACVAALGKDKVIGVRLPVSTENKEDQDLAFKICEYLGIKHYWFNIQDSVDIMNKNILEGNDYNFQTNKVYSTNLAPRIRMTYLYAIAALVGNARVANTSNYSESFIGWCTKWGDNVGDFAPIRNLYCSEVKRLGYELGLPEEFIEKAPADGLTGRTDEENFGFTYDELNEYIMHHEGSDETVEKIEKMHNAAHHKIDPIPSFTPERWTYENIVDIHVPTLGELEKFFREDE